jgi:hypothetical protein
MGGNPEETLLRDLLRRVFSTNLINIISLGNQGQQHVHYLTIGASEIIYEGILSPDFWTNGRKYDAKLSRLGPQTFGMRGFEGEEKSTKLEGYRYLGTHMTISNLMTVEEKIVAIAENDRRIGVCTEDNFGDE